MLPARSRQIEREHATTDVYELVIEEQIFNLHETEISFRQSCSNNVHTKLNVINVSDDLSYRYVVMEGLAVATLGVTGIVAYAR